MKRCPKCNRTFPDENQKFCTFDGGLLITAPAFDPNATMRATEAERTSFTSGYDPGPTSRDLPTFGDRSPDLPNPNETILASAPTAFFPRNTGPTGTPTSADVPAPAPPPVPLGAVTAGSTASTVPPRTVAPAPTEKRSVLPWILGSMLLILLLGGGGAAAVFFIAIKPRLEQMTQRRATTEEPAAAPAEENKNTAVENKPVTETRPEPDNFVPPADAAKFVNSKDKLDGKLAEHYVDFSFYYPGSWQSDPEAGIAGASNFARVFKTVTEDADEYTPESVALSWYTSNGTYDADVPVFPDRVEALSAQISKGLPNYKKVSEGPTQVDSLKAYEFRFTGVSKTPGKPDLPYWGRAIFVPPGSEGEKNGVTIIMLATAKATDIKDEADVGTKGDMALILQSFRVGKKD